MKLFLYHKATTKTKKTIMKILERLICSKTGGPRREMERKHPPAEDYSFALNGGQSQSGSSHVSIP